eukprot:g13613.t1
MMFAGLVHDGTVSSLDDPVHKYLPWWTKDPKDLRSTVTFRMLLTFTSGFGSGHPGEEFNTRAAREWRQQSQTLATGRRLGGKECDQKTGDVVSCAKYIYENVKLPRTPGQVYSYNSNHLQLAAAVAVTSSKLSIQQVIQKYLVEAFDMKDSSYPGLELCTSELEAHCHMDPGAFGFIPLYDRKNNYYMQVVAAETPPTGYYPLSGIPEYLAQPTWIRKLFVEADLVAGHFVIQLYDMASARWELEDGTRVYNYNDIYTAQGTKCLRKKWLPLFGRPKGRQVWALILEKAMAKFVGSYAHLSGGTEPFAFMALTGFPLVYVFQRPAVDQEETAALENHWQWRGAQYAGRNATGIGSVSLPVPDDLLDEELWEKLLRYMSRCSDGGSRVAGSRRARLDGPWLTGPFEPCP